MKINEKPFEIGDVVYLHDTIEEMKEAFNKYAGCPQDFDDYYLNKPERQEGEMWMVGEHSYTSLIGIPFVITRAFEDYGYEEGEFDPSDVYNIKPFGEPPFMIDDEDLQVYHFEIKVESKKPKKIPKETFEFSEELI